MMDRIGPLYLTVSMFKATNNRFDEQGFWSIPIDRITFRPIAEDFALFDQNGYDLCLLEQRYARANDIIYQSHREHRYCLKQPWFVQDYRIEGAVLNHSNLHERKGYSADARDQLLVWSRDMPLCHMLLSLKPKWGLDFAMDWIDRDGNVFEILHWEYDTFEFEDIINMKDLMAEKIKVIDFEQAAMYLLKNKDQWHHLDFFKQSEYKCNYFGIPQERFKMVAWQ